jgi:hypothetical protein
VLAVEIKMHGTLSIVPFMSIPKCNPKNMGKSKLSQPFVSTVLFFAYCTLTIVRFTHYYHKPYCYCNIPQFQVTVLNTRNFQSNFLFCLV